MSEQTRAARYSALAIALHWTIAALIVLQIVIAGRMEGRTPEAFAVVQFHKSIGITVLLLSLARLAWRVVNPPPPEPATLAGWERTLSTVVHWAFYVVMIGMPLTGWIMVSASRIVLPTLLFGHIPWPHLPGLPELAPAAKKVWHDTARDAHHLIIKGAYVLIALHVAGALKHQLFTRNEPVLARMAPGAVGGRWLEPRLFAILAGVIAVIAFGKLYEPPRPAMGVLPPPPVAPAEPVAPTPPAPVVAPAPAAAAAAPEPVLSAPAKWAVTPDSTLGFATAWSGDAIQGRFDKWTADILFSPDALDGSRVSVAIDLASAKTGDEQRDASLPSGDWFDTASHPKATFTATRFSKTGEGRFVAHGTLSLRGVSRPLNLPFRLKITGDRAEVSGVTSLDRTAFGVGQGEWKSTDQIPAKVTVTIALKAKRM
ncbi:YceI family protein [Phenylobacterium sp.]|uniref:YceI family protein n=1 Tax=Phenylobacterium sp. TaxID=1871053 RepID=UPI0025DD4C38|nr:YceI family protein [Phenylobacterium sp.]